MQFRWQTQNCQLWPVKKQFLTGLLHGAIPPATIHNHWDGFMCFPELSSGRHVSFDLSGIKKVGSGDVAEESSWRTNKHVTTQSFYTCGITIPMTTHGADLYPQKRSHGYYSTIHVLFPEHRLPRGNTSERDDAAFEGYYY